MVGVEVGQNLGVASYDRRVIAQEHDPHANMMKGLGTLVGLVTRQPAIRSHWKLPTCCILANGWRH